MRIHRQEKLAIFTKIKRQCDEEFYDNNTYSERAFLNFKRKRQSRKIFVVKKHIKAGKMQRTGIL